MKKFVFVISFALICPALFAPTEPFLALLTGKGINPYEKLLSSVERIESGNNPDKINWQEAAVGKFQIRPIRLQDYYDKTGIRYTLRDCFDTDVSDEIFLYYASQIGPYDFEKICRSWNGGAKGMSRKSTYDYWLRVKKYMK